MFFSFNLYQMLNLGTLRLKFVQCHILAITNCSFKAKTGWLTWSHKEDSVYVAAMLKSQMIWFMAVGRDRDQRRCQLLSRQPIPLAPLPSLPGTQHRARPPGPSRRMWGILSHICSLLCTFSPSGMKNTPTAPGMRPPCSTVSELEGGREAAMSWGSRQFGWWVEESAWNGTLLREWVILDRDPVILPAQQRSDHLF